MTQNSNSRGKNPFSPQNLRMPAPRRTLLSKASHRKRRPPLTPRSPAGRLRIPPPIFTAGGVKEKTRNRKSLRAFWASARAAQP